MSKERAGEQGRDQGDENKGSIEAVSSFFFCHASILFLGGKYSVSEGTKIALPWLFVLITETRISARSIDPRKNAMQSMPRQPP